MKTKLLPNYTKKIVIPLGILSLIGFMSIGALTDHLPMDDHTLQWILKDLILLSLLMMVFSKEKEESSQLNNLRSRKLIESIGFGAVVVMIDSLNAMIYSNDESQMKSGYELIVMMLLYYLVIFHITRNIKEGPKPDRE